MRFLLLLCVFLFSLASCDFPTSFNVQDSFLVNEKNLDQSVWGCYEPTVQRTYTLGFYLKDHYLVGVYCEAQTKVPAEAIKIMEKKARQDPVNFVFKTKMGDDYVDILGPGITFRLRPLNQKEGICTFLIGEQPSCVYSMARFR